MVLKNTNRAVTRGFTLIELLVVVAIIALLISILLPSLNRAKKQARQVVCCTNLKTQYDAAMFYAEEYGDYIPRGLIGINAGGNMETHCYATALLQYIGWNGNKGVQVNPTTIVDVPANAKILWNYTRSSGPNGEDPWINPYGPRWWRVLLRVLSEIPQYQCPDYPEVEIDPADQWEELPDGSPMDYVSSATVIPFPQKNIDYDQQSGMVWHPEGESGHVYTSDAYYQDTSKLEMLPPGTSPGSLIYVTEGHTSLEYKNDATRFHHFFLGQHLPFAGLPRIANDQRHPGGLDALFFDGHVRTMDLHEIDKGYPNGYAERLRWITVMWDGYTGD